jgi:hypothetical protein
MKRIALGLPQNLKVQLEKEAKAKGLTLSAYIRLLLMERKT